MRIVCIMGKRGTRKSQIEGKLEKFGYNRIISYTTRQPEDGEVNNVDYHFVSKEDFFTLVKKEIIMEWAEYDGDFYGSPHPIGSINNVVVVEPEGYQAIKNVYGQQVIGVYIDSEESLSDIIEAKKAKKALASKIICFQTRKDTDEYKFRGIENKVDLIVDGHKDIESITADILGYISKTRCKR